MSGRRRQSAQVGNLDSLLDTMANVTGILIVLLAVTQLSVSDAMERIRGELAKRPELTRQSLSIAEDEAARLAAALAPLRTRRAELEESRRRAREELAALRSENEAARADASAVLRFPGDVETLNAALERSESDKRRLEERIGKARLEIAVLDRDLARSKRAPLRREIVLPAPHPPPPGAQQVPVFVRYGRVVSVDVSALIGKLRQGTRQASEGRWIYGEGIPNFVDRSQIVAHFRSHDVGTRGFRWHLINNGGRDFWAQLEWRDESLGDSLDDLLGTSQFAEDLGGLSPRSHYFTFFVWEDSFEPYLVAREMVSQAGFQSGWVPHGQHAPFRQNLLGGGHVPVD